MVKQRQILLSLLVAVAFAVGLPSLAAAQEQRGPTRINFDERLIKGQTAKAGSVYIYQRQAIEIRSLVDLKRSWRAKVIRTVFAE